MEVTVRLKTSYTWSSQQRQFGACDERGRSDLQLGRGKRRIGGAEPQDIDDAAGRVSPHPLILVGEELVRCDLLGDLGERARVGRFLIHLGQFPGQTIEPLEECVDGNRLSRAPCQRLVELQRGHRLLQLLLLGLSGSAPARRHGARRCSIVSPNSLGPMARVWVSRFRVGRQVDKRAVVGAGGRVWVCVCVRRRGQAIGASPRRYWVRAGRGTSSLLINCRIRKLRCPCRGVGPGGNSRRV